MRRSHRKSTLTRRIAQPEDLECRCLLSVSPVGTEIPVGESSPADFWDPEQKDVATDSAGNFTAVWERYGETGSDIFARRFSASGNPLGDEFRVNSYTAGNQIRPTVAVNDSGQLVVAWQSWQQDGDDWGIFASFYDASGQLLAGDVLVNSTISGDQIDPDVAISPSGRVLVAWGPHGHLRFFDAAGTAEGAEFAELFNGENMRVAFDADGNYIVSDNDGTNLSWRRYSAVDVPETNSPLSLHWPHGTGDYDFAMNARGEFVAAVLSENVLYVQHVAASDVPLGLPIIEPLTGRAQSVNVAIDGAGNMAVATANYTSGPWASWGSVYFYDADNSPSDVLTIPADVALTLPPAIAFSEAGRGVLLIGQLTSSVPAATTLTAQRFETDTLNTVALLAPEIGLIEDQAIVPLELGSLEVRLSRDASVVGGTTGVHSITNPANWQLWLGSQNVSSQVTGITYDAGRVVLTLADGLPTGKYRLLASDAIQDATGQPLDGDGDGTPGGIAEQRFTIGPVQPVGPLTWMSSRGTIQTAANASGMFAAVSSRGTGLRAQFFDAAGMALTGEIKLPASSGSVASMQPRAFLDDAGQLQLFWRDPGGVNSWGTFDMTGALVRPLVALPTGVSEIAMAQDGRVAVLAGAGLHLLNADGTLATAPISRSALGAGNLTGVAFLSGGDVVVGDRPLSSRDPLRVHRLTAAGTPVGNPILVAAPQTTSLSISLAADSQGGFAVGWQVYMLSTPNRRLTQLQRFDANGATAGAPLLLAEEDFSNTSAQINLRAPQIGFDSYGRFIASWQQSHAESDQVDVAARGFLPDGTPMGDVFWVDLQRGGSQNSPALAVSPAGALAIGWLSDSNAKLQFFVLTEQPTIDLNALEPGLGYSAEVQVGGPAIGIAPDVAIEGLDGSPVFGATVRVRSALPGDQLLVVTSGTPLDATMSGGLLTIQGVANREVYEQVLETVRFQTTATRTNSSQIEIEFTVDFETQPSASAVARLTAYVPGTTAVHDRYLFYNNSIFDGSADLNVADSVARALKIPYFAGSGVATFDSVTSYTRGINGLAIRLSKGYGAISLDDFVFRVGQTDSLDTWTVAPAASEFAIRPYNSFNDIIAIAWPDGAIVNTWLEVTVLANANTGLAAPEVFYFGNRVGDTGLGSTAAAVTSLADQLAVRAHPTSKAEISNPYDFNRDGIVSISDELASRANAGFLLMLNLPAPASASPLAASVSGSDAGSSPTDFTLRNAVAAAISNATIDSQPARSAIEPAVAADPVRPTPVLNGLALAIVLADEADSSIAVSEAHSTTDGEDLGKPLLDELLTS